MSSVARTLVAGILALVAFALVWVGERRLPADGPRARWFLPTALGFEPGRPPAPATGAGYLTRAFTGFEQGAAAEWARRNALTPSLEFSHNLTTIFPPELYDRHPEFFPLEAGERLRPPPSSYYWNPDVARPDVATYAVEAGRRYFQKNPAAVSFSVGVNDAQIWGESPELLALASPQRWFRERPDYSRVAFTFANRVAEALSATHPDKYVGMLAYYWTENVPPFPIDRHIVPFLTADRSQGYDTASWQDEMRLQEKWGALATSGTASSALPRRLGIYDYVYGAGFLVPRVHTRLIADHLRHAREAGFTDYYAEMGPNWGLDGPMPWLLAELTRDPRQSRERLLEEYYARCFGPAARTMQRYFERCEEVWMAQPGPSYWLKHYRNESQATLFPRAVCRELRALLESAQRETAGSARASARVRLIGETFGVTERLVAFHQARIDLFRASVGGTVDPIRVSLGVYERTRRDFVDYTNALRQRQPLALYSFEWRDYFKNDPVPAALLALRDAGCRTLDVPLSPAATALWHAMIATSAPPAVGSAHASRELLVDPAMRGPLLPARTIAGLTYGVALPAGWQSRVEPFEHHRANVESGGDAQFVRIAGTKDTHLTQWIELQEKGLHEASLRVRGRVSSSVSVSLVVAFLDANHRNLFIQAHRLPEGEWSDWVPLRLAVLPPAKAAWIGYGLRVQHQQRDEQIEVRDFSLRALEAR